MAGAVAAASFDLGNERRTSEETQTAQHIMMGWGSTLQNGTISYWPVQFEFPNSNSSLSFCAFCVWGGSYKTQRQREGLFRCSSNQHHCNQPFKLWLSGQSLEGAPLVHFSTISHTCWQSHPAESSNGRSCFTSSRAAWNFFSLTSSQVASCLSIGYGSKYPGEFKIAVSCGSSSQKNGSRFNPYPNSHQQGEVDGTTLGVPCSLRARALLYSAWGATQPECESLHVFCLKLGNTSNFYENLWIHIHTM